MPWHGIRGHDSTVQMLRVALEQHRFPHAFLFVGPEGIGKRSFARVMARALLCENHAEDLFDPCGRCSTCVQILGETHPDILYVSRPEDRTELPILAIRQLTLDLALKPYGGRRRIAIVDDADDLSTEAANAFLKTLEEPPPGAILILIGTSAELQLDTILSRCRVVPFQPLSVDDLAEVLLERQLATDKDQAARLALQGEGSVRRALGLADKTLSQFRRVMLDTLARPGGIDAPGLARKLGAYINDAGKEASARRERAVLLIGEMARFFRGLLWQTAGLEPPAADPADRAAIAALAARLEPEDVFVMADRCLLAHYHVQRLAYMPNVLDTLCHDIAKSLQP